MKEYQLTVARNRRRLLTTTVGVVFVGVYWFVFVGVYWFVFVGVLVFGVGLYWFGLVCWFVGLYFLVFVCVYWCWFVFIFTGLIALKIGISSVLEYRINQLFDEY